MIIPEFEQGDAIPRILHQVFFGGRDGVGMPSAIRDNVDRIGANNPGWERRLYDDSAIEQFIGRVYGADVLREYERIDPRYAAARVDLFRYLLLYRTGGIYLDIKSTATRPLDDIARDGQPFALAQWQSGQGGRHEGWGFHPELAHVPGGEFQQFHIIAAPGHPFLQAAALRVLDNIARYRPWHGGVGKQGVLRTTGPIAYTLAIAPLLATVPHRRFGDEREIGLIYNVLGEGKHRGIFKTHYALNAAPIVVRTGAARVIDLLYTLPIRLFYAFLAVKARVGVRVRAHPELARALARIGIIK